MSLAMTKAVMMDSDVEMQDISIIPYESVSAAGEGVAEVSSVILRFSAEFCNGSPRNKKRKADGEARWSVKRVKGSFDDNTVSDEDTMSTYQFELENFTAEELEEMHMGYLVPYLGLYKSKQSSQHEQAPEATTFTDNVKSYQQVYQSEAGWNNKLWNPVWGTAEYITLNQKYDEYFIKHHPSLATFSDEPQGDLDNAIETLTMTAWAPLVQGKEVGYQGSDTVLLSYDDRLRKDDLTDAIDIIGKEYKALVGKVKFVFVVYSKFKDTGSEFGPTHAVHYAPGDEFVDEVFVRGDPLELQRHQDKHKIFLNGAYADFFQQNPTQVSASQYARTLFTFGTTIVHELSHVLYWHLDSEKLSKAKDYLEPLLFEDESAGEIGSSIERRLFGCNWTAIIHPKRGVDAEVVQFMVGYIEPYWMQAFLNKSWWEMMVETPSTFNSRAQWPRPRFFLTRKNLMGKNISNVKWDIAEPAWEVPMVSRETGPDGQLVRRTKGLYRQSEQRLVHCGMQLNHHTRKIPRPLGGFAVLLHSFAASVLDVRNQKLNL
ncbi:hypothetical protein SLS60_002297 [Paraconiothyrium brasiliense]|uniref:Uncharacterized protein n=1 Tax=Paraconiothyrium brasiliense TaxID=300254 RepID=A0ABR3S1W9_9PLEO